MTAQDKILGKFRKAISQSGSLNNDNAPLSLKEQLERAEKKKPEETKSKKDEEMYSKLNTNLNTVFRI